MRRGPSPSRPGDLPHAPARSHFAVGLRGGPVRRPAGRTKGAPRLPARSDGERLPPRLAGRLRARGRGGATSLVAAEVLERHDGAGMARAETAGQATDQTTRAVSPVGGPTFSQRSFSGSGRQGSSATVTSFLFNNVSGSELAVQQAAASRVDSGLAADGAAEGEAESVVEWVVPALTPNEVILWKHSVSESAATGAGAASAQANASFRVENVTQGTTLRSGGPAPLVVETLRAAPGDVVRLRFEANASASAGPPDGGADASAVAHNRFRVVDASQLVAADAFGPIRAAVVDNGVSDLDSLPPNSSPPPGAAAFQGQVGPSRSDVDFEFRSGPAEASIEMDVDLLLDAKRS